MYYNLGRRSRLMELIMTVTGVAVLVLILTLVYNALRLTVMLLLTKRTHVLSTREVMTYGEKSRPLVASM